MSQRGREPERDGSGRWAWFVLGGTVAVIALVVAGLVAAWRDDSPARTLLTDPSPLERQVLADRVVDVEEMDAALEAWVRCQERAGYRVVPTGGTYGRSDFAREGDADADAVTAPDAWDDRSAVRACAAEVTAATASGVPLRGLAEVLQEADLG
ncbi:MAG: hypothetical protein H5T83_11105 [Actinotalea sp.]|nr:hypothetical protein [Actinotalea sp.]